MWGGFVDFCQQGDSLKLPLGGGAVLEAFQGDPKQV